MKSLFGGSAAAVCALIAVTVLFNANPSVAETFSARPAPTPTEQSKTSDKSVGELPAMPQVEMPTVSSEALKESDKGSEIKPTVLAETSAADKASTALTQPQLYSATAYSFRGRTASGAPVRKGIIAADTRILPIGSRVRLDAGPYSGEYVVADTGGAVKGRKIDVWVPSNSEALRFGRRSVKLTVLTYGAKRTQRTKSRK